MLKGTISPVEAVPMVQIGYLTDTLSTFAASDGSFYFQGLRAGLWEIHVIPLNTLYADTTVMDTVFNQTTTTVSPNPIVLKNRIRTDKKSLGTLLNPFLVKRMIALF